MIGLNLYRILFSDKDIREAFLNVYGQFVRDARRDAARRLRLRLVFDREAEAVSRLPWEFLFIPEKHDQNLLQGFFFSGQRIELILTRFVPHTEIVDDHPGGTLAEASNPDCPVDTEG